MGRNWPALDVSAPDAGLLLAAADDFSPTAAEERGALLRLFFRTGRERDAARAALAPRFEVDAVDVSDEDWARRSQQPLAPTTVRRVTVVASRQTDVPSPGGVRIVIPASMGFGTGHHATTRLCLAALQQVDLTGAFVLDIGTGSGVLAIAAARLGAAGAFGIDSDEAAIGSARENLALNPEALHASFEVADLLTTPLPAADIVTANLTGPLLVRAAARLARALRPGGTLILSGLVEDERPDVVAAFETMELRWEAREDGWVGLAFQSPPRR